MKMKTQTECKNVPQIQIKLHESTWSSVRVCPVEVGFIGSRFKQVVLERAVGLR